VLICHLGEVGKSAVFEKAPYREYRVKATATGTLLLEIVSCANLVDDIARYGPTSPGKGSRFRHGTDKYPILIWEPLLHRVPKIIYLDNIEDFSTRM
jgi:hypothetical protein